MKKIVIAVDDGPTAEMIATAGFQLAKQLQAEIALVSVVDTTLLMTDGGVTPMEMKELLKNDFREKIQVLIDEIFVNYKVLTFVEEGKPHEVILKVAEEWETDLIVIGTHGRTGLAHLLMGSVAEKVIRHSTKPLFVIPSKS